MAQWLSERLGQPFIVENRPGGAGNIAIDAVVNAPADGYTLLLATIQGAVNATLYEKLNYNFIRDVAPVAGISRETLALEVNPSFPAKTVLELIAYAKANPGKLTMASAGIGTTPHVAGELFKMTAGVDMVHVPYRGGAPALTSPCRARCRRCLQPLVRQLSPSGPAGFVPWRYPPRLVPMCCRTFRPWLIFCPAMM